MAIIALEARKASIWLPHFVLQHLPLPLSLDFLLVPLLLDFFDAFEGLSRRPIPALLRTMSLETPMFLMDIHGRYL